MATQYLRNSNNDMSSPPFSWTCPHCRRDTTITDENVIDESVINRIQNVEGYQQLSVRFIVCPNLNCNKYTLFCILQQESDLRSFLAWFGPGIKRWDLIPSTNAKVFPDYVPQPIRDDYEEACLIVSLSPKASASLARRCLQGMIRDFWGVKEKPNLHAEIETIKERVDSDTWKAIDGTRSIGNIGAHMERDVDLIIEVDASEANRLIWLIQVLIKDWYIYRAERKANLTDISQSAEEKEKQRKSAPAKRENDADSS